ncbi:EAL domain-containing protein [Nakamurella sp. YIM 132087]|uniref:EAL domain-containing protein n=1 Tax=Nakamurella alba TaxID=2665158 RepID=A0A7K1FN21_9ACTN|nr:bifunctional diguanylate cyclase/phosphodiesterase [Nakamurella alba]MTD15528.1 EAL domain-containing protein [Nakamurella alba]
MRSDRLVCTIRDVTERVELQRRLHDLAYVDQLTGLPNRASLILRTREAVLAGPCALLFLDLDGFKRVNDGGGHAIGDEVLVEVGRRLSASVRDGQVAGRLGGDEFLVIVPDVGSTDVDELAGRLVTLIRMPYETGSGTFVIGVSIGVATREEQLPGTDEPPEHMADELVRHADIAAYEAKRNQDGWRHFRPALLSTAVARFEQDAEMGAALAANRVFLMFQPVVDLLTLQVVSAEALLRWRTTNGSLRGPNSLLEFAARTGQSPALLLRVLDRALAGCTRWPTAVQLSINLTPAQLHQPDLPDSVAAALARHRITPGRLILEITEDTLVRDMERTLAVVAQLRAIGVQVAVDQFGSGSSSLTHLLDLPLDQLKIDRSLIQRVDTSVQAAELVTGILRLAHTWNLPVVAEGIERTGQRNRLLEMSCRFGQGFLFAPALESDELAAMAHQELAPPGRMPTQRAAGSFGPGRQRPPQ